MKKLSIISFFFVLTFAALGQGSTVLWNESVNGPLSNGGATPATALGSLTLGQNSVIGAVQLIPNGLGGGTLINDYFTFSVPANTEISSLNLTTDKPLIVWWGNTSFSGEIGSVIDPTAGNILSQMGLISVGPGSYGMYVANYDLDAPSVSTANYQLDFSLVAAPEPSTIALGTLGAAALLLFRRRKK